MNDTDIVVLFSIAISIASGLGPGVQSVIGVDSIKDALTFEAVKSALPVAPVVTASRQSCCCVDVNDRHNAELVPKDPRTTC